MHIEGSYQYYIATLSIIVAILASSLTLSLVAKTFDARGKLKYFLLISSSLILGCGIWAMHFIGMLAFRLPVPVKYDTGLTILSMLSSMILSFIALYILMFKKHQHILLLFSSFFIGNGIISMHYFGMAGMVMPVEIIYNMKIVGVSALVAYLASYLSLTLFIYYRNHSPSRMYKWLAALAMGIAMSGMHYTGMTAASFKVTGKLEIVLQSLDVFLFYGVTLAVFSILVITWSSMFLEHHAIEKMAYHDALTGLPNRHDMNRFLQQERQDEEIGVICIDLDDFKTINDTLGHAIGDELLKRFVARLNELTRKNNQFFRIGGDEFLCLIRQCEREETEQLAQKILQANREIYQIEGYQITITTSIGISIGNSNDYSIATLLNHADAALYLAKEAGKNQYFVYNCDMAIKEERIVELETELWHAIERQQLFVVYQPKWNLENDQLAGFEALLRWQHPRLGLISPNEFIPIAEKNGLILPITEWVFEQVGLAYKRWEAKEIAQPISVNVSRHSFQLENIYEWIQAITKKLELDPKQLGIEITESTIMQNTHTMKQQIQALQSIGITVSMDNFGTGYSSLSLLNEIPFDELKIDRFFIQALATPKKLAILKAIITMADSMDVKVVAEGVEDEAQAKLLLDLGCHMVQGFFYSKPMEEHLVDEWICEFSSINIS